jgi:hypothetical protein
LGEGSGDNDEIGTEDHSLFSHCGIPDSMPALFGDSGSRLKWHAIGGIRSQKIACS